MEIRLEEGERLTIRSDEVRIGRAFVVVENVNGSDIMNVTDESRGPL